MGSYVSPGKPPLHPETQQPPPAGFTPKSVLARRCLAPVLCGDPGELRISKSRAPIKGRLRRSRKSDFAAEADCLGRLCHLPPCAPPEGRTVGARLRTLGAPLGTHTVGACCASASNKRASCLRTLRISECVFRRIIQASKKRSKNCRAEVRVPFSGTKKTPLCEVFFWRLLRDSNPRHCG